MLYSPIKSGLDSYSVAGYFRDYCTTITYCFIAVSEADRIAFGVAFA